MNILIDKTGFINKGAELMLYSVMDKIKDLYPNETFVCRRIPPKDINSLYWLNEDKRKNMIPLRFLPSFITKNVYGFVKPKAIDMVLDAGGFRFGDQWANGYTKDLISKWKNFYESIKNKKGKIIFLPQAFGPFEKDLSHHFIKTIYPYIDLLIARENESYEHLTKIFGENEKIKCYPDFTNIYKPVVNEKDAKKFKSFEAQICIIPNSKMITHVPANVAEKYMPFMAVLAKDLRSKGHKVFFLNHEGEGDEKLIQDIIERTGQSFDYLTRLDANQVKYIIGNSKLCITSRFHGLVSALSQNVPAFCTSWSHKYLELLKDYDFEQGLLDLEKSKESIEKVVSLLENSDLYDKIKSKINNKAALQKELTESMWEEVTDVLQRC